MTTYKNQGASRRAHHAAIKEMWEKMPESRKLYESLYAAKYAVLRSSVKLPSEGETDVSAGTSD